MSSSSRGSKRSERSGGSGSPDAESIKRAIEEHLNPGDRSKFGVGEVQPITLPGIGEVWTDGLNPVDPTDCQRWPDSPYCSNWKPIPPSVTAVAKPVKYGSDKCITFITIDFSVGPFKMPSMTVAKVNDAKDCELPPENPPGGSNSGDPTTEEEIFGEAGQLISIELDYTFTETPNCIANFSGPRYPNYEKPEGVSRVHFYENFDRSIPPTRQTSKLERYHSCIVNSNSRPISWKSAFPGPIIISKTKWAGYPYISSENVVFMKYGSDPSESFSYSHQYGRDVESVSFWYLSNGVRKLIYFARPVSSGYATQIAKGGFTNDAESSYIRDVATGYSGPDVPYDLWYCTGWFEQIYQVSNIVFDPPINSTPPPPIDEPPKLLPPSSPPLPPDMNCCNSMDALTRMTREIHKSLRADMFGKGQPAIMPERMVRPGKTGTVKLNDYIDVFEFLVRYIDRIIGMAPWSVFVEDTDPVKEGNQSITSRFESIGEMLKSLLEVEANKPVTAAAPASSTEGDESIINMRTLFNITHAILQEVGVTHKIVAEVRAELDEQTEGLGYAVKDAIVGVPFAFSPLKKALKDAYSGSEEELRRLIPALLSPSTVNVTYSRNEDKKTLYQILTEISDRLKLLEGANTTRVKSHAQFKTVLEGMELGMDAAQLLMLRQIKQALGAVDKNTLQDFMDNLEKRYTEGVSPVGTDEGKPYQQPRSNEPKIVVQEQKSQK